ncbi:MAG: hypothetical protein HYW49_09065 [Deltaproteobacteria bacterium]|nr:hypothetical protein [Deltaproteobacteria bacterium]
MAEPLGVFDQRSTWFLQHVVIEGVFKSGARGEKVGEHPAGLYLPPNQRATLVIEAEAYPEPRSLNQGELAALIKRFGGTLRAAEHIGASEAFVRQNIKPKC